ncbi:SET and MYND domain-containing protein 4-like [Culex pipiens pallens]|uniref:SET and MYND domain-containing protein 4-like n=1 Tax=Culex pipiens pallens TaxID=42434 RepID=UPI0019549E6F|nr:SET and MYND domain-containing protein 4-like [Culex pipiens pallens]
MQSSPPPDHLQSFNKKWASVLHKIYPEFTAHHVAAHVQLEPTPATAADLSVVILQMYAAMVEHFCRSGGSGAKDSSRADQFCEQGSRMLDEASGGPELVSVAEVFNRSLAYAEFGGRAMFRGYELRSVLCYNLEQFGLCLRNIENALQDGEGGNLNKILMLKNFCLGHGEGQRQDDEGCEVEATLSHAANPTIPNVVAGIELEVGDVYGRHLVAKRNFDFGDTLLIDDPYVVVADLGQQYRQCHHCLKFCTLELLPCPDCVEVMFCSPECAKLAQQRYHRFECPILRGLYTLDKIGRMAILVARIVFTAVTAFNNDLDALRAHINRFDKGLHPFMLNWTTSSWTTITPAQRYAAVHALASNKGIRDSETNNSFAIVAIFASEFMLFKSPAMASLANTRPRQDLIRELVYHHALTVGTSMRISNRDRSLGAYPLASMINHGCGANVMRVGLPGGRVAIVATRQIAPGEQIFEDYTTNLADTATHTDRHHYLRWAYQIDCQCPASFRPVDELTWEDGIARALTELTEGEMKQCDRDDLAVLMERFPTWMGLLEPRFAEMAKVRDRFVQMARQLYELAFNGRPEEERYGRAI